MGVRGLTPPAPCWGDQGERLSVWLMGSKRYWPSLDNRGGFRFCFKSEGHFVFEEPQPWTFRSKHLWMRTPASGSSSTCSIPRGCIAPAVTLRTDSPSTATFENPSSTIAARRADGSSTLG